MPRATASMPVALAERPSAPSWARVSTEVASSTALMGAGDLEGALEGRAGDASVRALLKPVSM